MMNDQLLAIARRLGIVTLDTRNSDRLDFREVAVWQIEEALEAAYEAGKQAAREEKGGQGRPAFSPDNGTRP
jgi:Family of unknown function (DUF6900)